MALSWRAQTLQLLPRWTSMSTGPGSTWISRTDCSCIFPPIQWSTSEGIEESLLHPSFLKTKQLFFSHWGWGPCIGCWWSYSSQREGHSLCSLQSWFCQHAYCPALDFMMQPCSIERSAKASGGRMRHGLTGIELLLWWKKNHIIPLRLLELHIEAMICFSFSAVCSVMKKAAQPPL